MNKQYTLPISVIIPCFNYAHYLEACITSVIEQNNAAQEIIVIDDGSTDDTKIIVQAISEKNKKIKIRYDYQENKGVSSARNHGYKLATGAYLLFLDADDKLLPNAFEIIRTTLSTHDNVDMIFGGYQTYNLKGKQRIRVPETLSIDNLDNVTKLLSGEMIGLRPSSSIIKRTVMDEILFMDNVHIGEDTLFFAQVLFIKNCSSIQELIVEMRRHKDSLRENYQRMLETDTNGIDQVFSVLPKTALMKELYLKQITNSYLRIGRMAYIQSDYHIALNFYAKAFKIQPHVLLQWKHLVRALVSIAKKCSLDYLKFN